MKKIAYTVRRGQNTGLELKPHRYENGFFRAHKNNSRNAPAINVRTTTELVNLVKNGYHVRMSAEGHPPSTVKPELRA